MLTATELEAVEVRVAEVRPAASQPDNPLFAAILAEVGGSRAWSVVMRKPEADNLVLHLRGTLTERPMTYTFMAALVGALDGRVLEGASPPPTSAPSTRA
jgi:bifunctional DNase/RNase